MKGAVIPLAGRLELDFQKLTEWWAPLREFGGDVLQEVEKYDTALRSGPAGWNAADSISMASHLRQLLTRELEASVQEIRNHEIELDELDRLIYDRQVKEGGLARADRAFRFAILVAVIDPFWMDSKAEAGSGWAESFTLRRDAHQRVRHRILYTPRASF